MTFISESSIKKEDDMTYYAFVCKNGVFPILMESDAAAIAEARRLRMGLISVETRDGRIVWASRAVEKAGGRQLSLL